MNRNLKAIGAAILAAVMFASFAGCSKKEDNGVYVDKNGNVSVNESKFEDHVNSVFGGETNSSNPTNSTPTEEKFAVTDEIKNAALGSGLIQLNNDIFQRGGYITVADFVEKYKDNYDITYNCPQGSFISEAGTYDECKEYLVEYNDEYQKIRSSLGYRWCWRGGLSVFAGCRYYLTLTPKGSNKANKINAYVVNATSPDAKITLDKAIVAEVEPAKDEHSALNAPEWIPMGFNADDFRNYESENKNYSISNIGEALEAKGLKKSGEKIYEEYRTIPYSENAENYNTYWVSKSYAGCYVLGEENLFGAKPFYYFSFDIDKNTDKVQYVSCTLEGFIKE